MHAARCAAQTSAPRPMSRLARQRTGRGCLHARRVQMHASLSSRTLAASQAPESQRARLCPAFAQARRLMFPPAPHLPRAPASSHAAQFHRAWTCPVFTPACRLKFRTAARPWLVCASAAGPRRCWEGGRRLVQLGLPGGRGGARGQEHGLPGEAARGGEGGRRGRGGLLISAPRGRHARTTFV